MKRLKKLKARFINTSRTPNQKRQAQKKLDEVFNFIFEKIEKQLQK